MLVLLSYPRSHSLPLHCLSSTFWAFLFTVFLCMGIITEYFHSLGITLCSHISLRSLRSVSIPEPIVAAFSSSTMMPSTPGDFLHFALLIISSISLLSIVNISSSSLVFEWLPKCSHCSLHHCKGCQSIVSMFALLPLVLLMTSPIF